MFNLFRNIKEVKSDNTNEVIAAIHNEFDIAGEKLLQEAKEILASDVDIDKGTRLQKIGFYRSQPAVDAITISDMRTKSKEVAENVEYFRTYYPNYKFITEEMVESICKKYGLLCAEVSKYIGDVPEKNISEIEKFELRQEDMIRHECGFWENGHWLAGPGKGIYGYLSYSFTPGSYPIFIRTPETQKEAFQPRPMKICASKKDFDTKNMEIKNGYTLQDIPDPIVLQTVKGGYIIVSKWGLESKDPSLVNETQN